MISLVAHACRLDEKSIRIFGRELRNAKMLNSGGRGVNAPDMSARDLATLLIAVLATNKPAEAVELTEYIGAMQLSAPQNWAVATDQLPSSPDHTFQELMEAFCDPEVRVPSGIVIEVTGTAHVVVSNGDLQAEELESPTCLYHDRSECDRRLSDWREVDIDDLESEQFRKVLQDLYESPMSLHGLVTSRKLAGDTIELIKTFVFPSHYQDELREAMSHMEKSKT